MTSRHHADVRHRQRVGPGRAALSRDEERQRPLYARMLGLQNVHPGGLLCFVFFEGSIVLAFLLALAELVSWWAVLVLPASVAVMVKINDGVAAAVARSAARVPERERDRFLRQMGPAVGRAAVPAAWPGAIRGGSPEVSSGGVPAGLSDGAPEVSSGRVPEVGSGGVPVDGILLRPAGPDALGDWPSVGGTSLRRERPGHHRRS